MKLLSALLLITFSNVFSQSDFIKLGLDADGNKVSFKIDKSEYEEKFVWMKIEFAPMEIKKKNGDKTTAYRGNQLTYMSIDCNKKTMNQYKYYDYSPKGMLLNEEELLQRNSPIVPESISDQIYQRVCN